MVSHRWIGRAQFTEFPTLDGMSPEIIDPLLVRGYNMGYWTKPIEEALQDPALFLFDLMTEFPYALEMYERVGSK